MRQLCSRTRETTTPTVDSSFYFALDLDKLVEIISSDAKINSHVLNYITVNLLLKYCVLGFSVSWKQWECLNIMMPQHSSCLSVTLVGVCLSTIYGKKGASFSIKLFALVLCMHEIVIEETQNCYIHFRKKMEAAKIPAILCDLVCICPFSQENKTYIFAKIVCSCSINAWNGCTL